MCSPLPKLLSNSQQLFAETSFAVKPVEREMGGREASRTIQNPTALRDLGIASQYVP